MRLGVLDVGSNAAQLQVVDAFAGGPPLPIRAVKVPTRLGQDISVQGEIAEGAADRLVAAVRHALSSAQALRVDQLYPLRHRSYSGFGQP